MIISEFFTALLPHTMSGNFILLATDWIANPLPQNQIAADHMTHMMFNMAANSSDDDSDD